MLDRVSIFLDFSLPNATTWFYFSFLLSISLFFKFSRVVSVRNWDVITIFLLVPGLMVVQGARPGPVTTPHLPAVRLAALVGQGTAGALPAAPTALGSVADFARSRDPAFMPKPWQWLGYFWLMVGSVYLLCRCLYDLALVQRPALAPNLTFGGLAFLAIALMSCLIAVALRPTPDSFDLAKASAAPGVTKPVGPESATLALAREWIEPRWWLERGSAVLCHLVVVLGLIFVGRRHFHDATAGMAAATFYVMLPYTGLYVSQVHHVLPMALVVWALVVFPWPILSGMLLGLAAGTAYFPGLLLPIWASFYWRRGMGRFLLAFLFTFGLTLATLGVVLWMDGALDATLLDVFKQTAWQPWKVPHTEGFWTGVHAVYRLPVFVAYVVFLLATVLWPMPKNLAHVIALSAAVIIGIQLWYADQGGVYVLWYLPLLVLLVFRPNLADRRPPEIPESDWMTRLRRAVVRFITRQPAAHEKVAG